MCHTLKRYASRDENGISTFKDPTKNTESSCFNGAKKSIGETVSKGPISNSSKHALTSINGRLFGRVLMASLKHSLRSCFKPPFESKISLLFGSKEGAVGMGKPKNIVR